MKKYLLALLLLVLLPTAVLAESNLTILDMPEASQQSFLKNVGLVVWKDDYADRPIKCFDVREDGMIALGFERPEHGKYAAVLDSDGVFQYGYVFDCSGNFLLDWTDEGLGIIWIRSNVIAVFDEAGECLSIQEFKTDSAFSQYVSALHQTSRRVGDMTYTLRNDHMLSGLAINYGRLVRTDAQGNEVILHDASDASMRGTVGMVGVILFVLVCGIVSLRKRQAARIDNPLKP